MAASTLSSSGMIDPTKQAEYPIILGERLARKSDKPRSRLINIQYNYKTKAATSQQRSVITKSPHSRDHFNLTITDKAPSAEQNVLTYSYQGSVDPAQSASESQDHNLVLVFDATRKAFVLEPVATQLNFNLRSAPAKTQKQVIQQYPQLRTLQDDEHTSGDDREGSGNDDGLADDDNPYDYRHFLAKDKDNSDDVKSGSGNATPEPYAGTSKAGTPLATAAKPALSPRPRPKAQTNSLRQKKPATDSSRASKAAPAKSQPKSPLREPERQGNNNKEQRRMEKEEEPEEIVFESTKSSPSDTGTGAVSSQKSVPSPGSNIIIDGDLIIDMGSPPPARPFKVNPAHFSSNNTPANDEEEEEEDGYEDIEDLRLPSPVPTNQRPEPIPDIQVEDDNDEAEEEADDDLLAAEMEAAFAEEAQNQQAQGHIPSQHDYHGDSSEDDSPRTLSLMASQPPIKRPPPAPSNPELARSPSQLDGMSIDDENLHRSKGVNFIAQVGIMLKLPQPTLATAAVYLHRFFMRYVISDRPERTGIHAYPIAATSLFLATKVEENVRRMKELVVAVCRVAQKQPNLVVDEQSKEFWKWRDTILHHEDILLEALCFDLQLEQPYKILYDYICFFGVNDNKHIRNSSWAFLNDSMYTVLSAFYAAASHCDLAFEDDELGRPWWEQIDVDITQVRRACTRMAELYESNAQNKHNQFYPTIPPFNDGVERTRILRPRGTLEALDPTSRKRSREPEGDSRDRPPNSQDDASPNGRRSPKRSRVGSDAATAAGSFGGDGALLPPPSSNSPSSSSFSQDRPSNGHPHQSQHRYQHPLPPTPRTTFPPCRNSETKNVDPIQQRIDQIHSPTKRIPDKREREREDDERHRDRRPSYSSATAGRDQQPPPPPEHRQQPPPPPPEPMPKDDDGGGSEEGEL
ncbi:uncharacterized protein BDV17DRAFT_282007 [Aspergillus undulatus]|uniref:uncharacterized protein n=1 Tax=Aspergillus undulatus TaxID=1810928 RepID=UPI003CCD34D6